MYIRNDTSDLRREFSFIHFNPQEADKLLIDFRY